MSYLYEGPCSKKQRDCEHESKGLAIEKENCEICHYHDIHHSASYNYESLFDICVGSKEIVYVLGPIEGHIIHTLVNRDCLNLFCKRH